MTVTNTTADTGTSIASIGASSPAPAPELLKMPAPGQPRPEDGIKGPIGFFGGTQGATPKYAKNTGGINDDFRESMARFFITPAGKPKEVLATRIAHLPEVLRGDGAFTSVLEQIYGNGYIDFLLQSVQTGLSEKVELTENLGGGYTAYYFGTSPQMLQCSGALINSMQDDQVVSMVRLYAEIIRGTKLAEHGETLRMRYDSFMYSGTVHNLQWSLAAENEMFCPFSFTFLVKTRIEMPSKYFRPVALKKDDGQRGQVDAVGPTLVPQKASGTVTNVAPGAPGKEGPPPPGPTVAQKNMEALGRMAAGVTSAVTLVKDAILTLPNTTLAVVLPGGGLATVLLRTGEALDKPVTPPPG